MFLIFIMILMLLYVQYYRAKNVNQKIKRKKIPNQNLKMIVMRIVCQRPAITVQFIKRVMLNFLKRKLFLKIQYQQRYMSFFFRFECSYFFFHKFYKFNRNKAQLNAIKTVKIVTAKQLAEFFLTKMIKMFHQQRLQLLPLNHHQPVNH